MGQIFSRIAVTVGLAAALSLPAAAATSTWQIDPAHSAAQFAVRHLGISTVRGAFTSVKGAVQFDDKDVTKSSVDVTVDVIPWTPASPTATRISAAIISSTPNTFPPLHLGPSGSNRSHPAN